MQDYFDFSGKKFVSSRRLAEKYGYTNDHISRLCRQGKIPGQLISRAWFVDEDALLAYFNFPKNASGNEKSNFHSNGSLTLGENETKSILNEEQGDGERFDFGGAKTGISARSQTSKDTGRLTSGIKKDPIYFPAGNIVRDSVLFISIFVGIVSAYAYSVPMMREVMVEEMASRIKAGETLARIAEDEISARVPVMESITQKSFSNVAAVSGSFSGQIIGTGREVAVDVYITLSGIPNNVKTKTKNTILGWLGIGSEFESQPKSNFRSNGSLTSTSGDEGKTSTVAEELPSSSASIRVVERVVERVIEKPAPFLVQSSGIGKDELEKRLQEVNNALLQEIYRVSAGTNGAPYVPQVSNYSPIAITQRIDQLSGVTISNATISGSTFSGTVSGYLPLSGGALTGALTGTSLTLSDALNVSGAVTIYSVPSFPSFAATSTTATSTIAGHLDVTGNINLNGAFLQNGAPFIGSQWVTSGSNIYYNTGSVGIGTTSPSAKFSVGGVAGDTTGHGYFTGGLGVGVLNTTANSFRVGQCVTGDTRLRRRRKRADGDYDYDEPEIIDIEEGDEILSLDTKTGEMVWAKVKRVAYMGNKPIVRLTTASGKTIRTTGNHPYFAASKHNKNSEMRPKTASTEDAAANPVSERKSHVIAFIDYANIKAWYKDKGYEYIDLRLFYDTLVQAGVGEVRFYYGNDSKNISIGSFFKKLESFGYIVITKAVQYFRISLTDLLSKNQNLRWLEAISENLRDLIVNEAKRLDTQGIELLQPKANFDVEITTDALTRADEFSHFILFSGDGDFVPLIKQLKKIGKKTTVVSGKRHLSSALQNITDGYVHMEDLTQNMSGLFGGSKESNQQGSHKKPYPALLERGREKSNISIADLLGLSSGTVGKDDRLNAGDGAWTKVTDLREGEEIAVLSGAHTVWDKIVKKESLPSEDVYDIEIEGTHNFVGNDIIAHNTAFIVDPTGNVGIGTTSPYAKLSVVGEIVGAYFTGTTTATSTLGGGLSATRLYTTATSTFSGLEIPTGGLSLGSLTGFLKATAGKVATAAIDLASDITGVLGVGNGGTGASTFGQGWLSSSGGTNAITASTSPTVNYLTATSTTATSTFAGGLQVGSSALTVLQNGNVGVGTISPSGRLHVADTSGNLPFYVTSNIGDGTGVLAKFDRTTTSEVLTIKAASGITLQSSATLLLLNGNGQGVGIDATYGFLGVKDTTPDALFEASLNGLSTFDAFQISSDAANDGDIFKITNYISNDGRVGIGTTSPYAKLSVVGPVVAAYFHATSTNATSTFAGNILAGGNITSSAADGATAVAFNLNTTNALSTSGAKLLSLKNQGTEKAYVDKDGVLKTQGAIRASNATNALDVQLINTGLQLIDAGAVTFGTAATGGFGGWAISGDGRTGSALVVNATESYGALTGNIVAFQKAGVTKAVIDADGDLGVGTTSPYAKLTAWGDSTGKIFEAVTSASTTALSISATGFATTTLSGLNISGSATSTSNVGWNITTGCYAVNGTCVGGGAGASTYLSLTDTPSSFTASAIPYTNTGASALLHDSKFVYTGTNLGVGTSSPYAKLSVVGEAVAEYFTATSTAATSTFAGGFSIAGGKFLHDYGAGVTSIENLELGPISFDTNAGKVSWIDMPVTSSAAAGTAQAYSAQIDGNELFTVYGQSDGAGGIKNTRVIVGTSTDTLLGSTNIPYGSFIVADGALCVDDGSTENCDDAARTRGYIYAKSSAVTAIDLAENYPTRDQTLSAGEIVMLDPNNPVFMSRYDRTVLGTSTSPTLLGVVSTEPGLLLGGYSNPVYESERKVPVALSGRVPVKVNDEGGAIVAGDRIAPSSVPGVGKKASTFTHTVGIALEPFSGTGTGEIYVFMDLQAQNLSVSGGTTTIAMGGNGIMDLDGKDLVNVASIASALGSWSIDANGNLVVENLEVRGTAKVGSPERRTGITLYDEIDGSPYCLTIAGGLTKTTSGECVSGGVGGGAQQAPSTGSGQAAAASVPTSEPVADPVPDPTPEPAPEPVPEPAPIVEQAPEPTATTTSPTP